MTAATPRPLCQGDSWVRLADTIGASSRSITTLCLLSLISSCGERRFARWTRISRPVARWRSRMVSSPYRRRRHHPRHARSGNADDRRPWHRLCSRADRLPHSPADGHDPHPGRRSFRRHEPGRHSRAPSLASASGSGRGLGAAAGDSTTSRSRRPAFTVISSMRSRRGSLCSWSSSMDTPPSPIAPRWRSPVSPGRSRSRKKRPSSASTAFPPESCKSGPPCGLVQDVVPEADAETRYGLVPRTLPPLQRGRPDGDPRHGRHARGARHLPPAGGERRSHLPRGRPALAATRHDVGGDARPASVSR